MAKRTDRSEKVRAPEDRTVADGANSGPTKLTYVREALPDNAPEPVRAANWGISSEPFTVGPQGTRKGNAQADTPVAPSGHVTAKSGDLSISPKFSSLGNFLNEAEQNKSFKSRLHASFLLKYSSISEKEQSENEAAASNEKTPSVSQRLAELQKFADNFQGKGVADYVREHFPEIAALEALELTSILPHGSAIADGSTANGADAKSEIASPIPAPPFPSEAPVKWKDREPGETAPDFTRRVYGPWLEGGISKRALRKLDAALVNELNTWVRNGNEMPTDIQLLTVGEENARLLSSGPDGIKEHLGKFTGLEAIREAQRLHNARYRQK